MANINNIPIANLPLPPLEYDVQYMNSLVRIINYFMQQQQNPGSIRGSALYLSDGDPDSDIELVPNGMDTDVTIVKFMELPTSTTGLSPGHVWNDSGTLKIVI